MGKSSKDKRDAYYRLAKEQGWRARSAFKLLQLDEEFNLFEGVTRVVDLCAAPGSWSQVLSRVLIKGEKFGRRAWEGKLQEFRDVVREAMEEGDESDDDMSHSKVKRRPADRAATKSKEGHEWPEERGGAEDPPTEEAKASSHNGRPHDGQPQDSITPPDPQHQDGVPVEAPKKEIRIVAIDLQPISPLPGITMIRADITHPSTIPLLLEALDPETYSASSDGGAEAGTSTPVDLILSDGAPDVTGLHDLDIYIQAQLLYSALNLAIRVLKPGGTFVAKIFRAKDVDLLYAQLRILFAKVTVAKPRSSRASSLEAFVVCEGFAPPEGLRDVVLGVGAGLETTRGRTKKERRVREDGVTVLELGSEDEDGEDDKENGAGSEARRKAARWIAPFLACGDLGAPDADATYKLPEGYKSLDPVQPPTAPPYKKALEMRRAAGGAYGKTKKQG